MTCSHRVAEGKDVQAAAGMIMALAGDDTITDSKIAM
jgi:hypothetical protein